jgi:3-oxoacyl-[acyl-carrier-protein] synthase-3
MGILGTGSSVPDRVVTNDEIGRTIGVDDEWIQRKTGVITRRRILPGQATSDLALSAANHALDAAGIRAWDLSVIVVATSTPDHPLPPTACYLQRHLPDCHAAAFDVNAVCSGFLYALATGQALLHNLGGYALVIGADTYSTILDPTDRRTYPLFGDGAGAVVLGPRKRDTPTIEHLVLFTDGAHTDLIRVPAGGSRLPCTPDVHRQGLHYFAMDGRGVRTYISRELPRHLEQFLRTAATPPDRVDHFIPHQANAVMLRDLVPELGLRFATVHETASTYGNTAAASIPLTLDHAVRAGKISTDDTVLLAGFGGGMAIGLALVRW